MKYLILGIIQGLTEFLPVSSSGHLVIFTKLFGLPTDLFFDALVHVATVLVVLIYFRKDVWNLIKGFFAGLIRVIQVRSVKKVYYESVYFKLSCLMLVAIFATGVIGISFQDYFEGWFDSLNHVGYFLLLTGALLLLAEKVGTGVKKADKMTRMDALLIGAAQGAAIAPGLSRSGATISMALLRDLDRGLAARFSFIMSVPVILGAALIQGKSLLNTGVGEIPIFGYILGFIAAFISGWFAIRLFLVMLKKLTLKPFAYYCFAVAFIVLLWAHFI